MTSNEIPTITSLANPKVKELYKLKPNRASFLVEGYHLVEMAFFSNSLDEVLFSSSLPPYLEGVKATKVTKEIIEKLAFSKSPEPILGICHKKENGEGLGDRILVIDRVQDPGNLGTMLRTALAFGFKDIIFLPNTCSPFNEKAIASSQGALFSLSFHFPSSEEEFLEMAEKEGLTLFATSLRDALPLEEYRFDPKGKIAVIMGNEGNGVSENLLSKSKARLRISMEGIESLNVGVATGILLHRIYVL